MERAGKSRLVCCEWFYPIFLSNLIYHITYHENVCFEKEIYQAIDHTKDNEILEAVYTILKSTVIEEKEEATELMLAQKKKLDKRLADHKAGKLKYYTIDEVRKRYLKQ